MRLTAGRYKGHRLLGLGNQRLVRPTQSAVRETLFNWLHNDLGDWRCLDLFAGSGSLSWEALSRGASQLVLVERNRYFCARLNKQAAVMHAAAQIRIFCGDAISWLRRSANRSNPASLGQTQIDSVGVTSRASYHLIFVDPPYASALLDPVLALVGAKNLLGPGGFLYYESARPLLLSSHRRACFAPYRAARRGQVYFGLLQQVHASRAGA